MNATSQPPLIVGPGAPQVRLLDARDAGLDEPGLRSAARSAAAAAGAPYSSTSYRFPYAVVAWHESPVGVDVERVEPFDAAFVESISTPAELGRAVDAAAADAYAASLWSSKEALAKALGDAMAYDPRRLESPMFWAGGRSGPWRAAELSAPPGHNAWLCWRVRRDE